MISRTVIWLTVSVPVLSEQTMVVLPSVSTAGSLRIIARRRAIRATPIDNVIVTAAGSPSGIAPTASATAAINIANADSPRSQPTRNVTAAKPRITTNNSRLNAAILRVSGVSSSSAVEINFEMCPTCVFAPVAKTTPRA